MSTKDSGRDADPFGDALDVSSRESFAIEVQRPTATVVVLRVEGKLDLWTSLPLMDAIIDAFHEHPELIAVDVSGVLSLDGTGLKALVEGSHRIEEARVRFSVVCPAGGEVARLLGQTEAQRALNVHESLDDALKPWLDEAGELPAGV